MLSVVFIHPPPPAFFKLNWWHYYQLMFFRFLWCIQCLIKIHTKKIILVFFCLFVWTLLLHSLLDPQRHLYPFLNERGLCGRERLLKPIKNCLLPFGLLIVRCCIKPWYDVLWFSFWKTFVNEIKKCTWVAFHVFTLGPINKTKIQYVVPIIF